jgi:nitroreductase / dihydropteridine reductase
MSLIQNLQWRYATKKMNGEKISDDKLNAILDATNLSASSYGLQPYKVVVVSNDVIKEQLQAAAYGQVQVGASSHILVFCVPLQLTADDAKAFIENVATTRSIPKEALAGYEGMIAGTINSLSNEQQQVWAAKQAYIALGTAMIAAAEQEVDACPMEGFDKVKFDEILHLKEKGFTSVVILPIGYRAVDDATSKFIKVRKPKEEMFQFVS